MSKVKRLTKVQKLEKQIKKWKNLYRKRGDEIFYLVLRLSGDLNIDEPRHARLNKEYEDRYDWL